MSIYTQNKNSRLEIEKKMLLEHFKNRSQNWRLEIFDWTEFLALSKI